MNRKIIEALVKSRTWSFAEISNMKITISNLCDEIYNDSKLIDRFEMIREVKINERFVGYTFEDSIREATKIKLSGEIAEVITEMLGEATISFGNENNGGNENEISERSVGGESHKERTTDEKKNSKNKK
jgi:hypothetical protein